MSNLKRVVLATLLFVAAPIAAANAQGFLVGVVTGGMLFGGNQYGSSAATVLYSATDDTLKETDPLSVRMAAIPGCFQTHYKGDKTGRSIGELFAELMDGTPRMERTILQVVRVFHTSETQCATIWYVYTEK